MDERLQIFQDKMEKSLANLNEEFAGIRAGRANPQLPFYHEKTSPVW